MSEMRTEISFDQEKIAAHEYSREDIHHTIRQLFQEKGLVCISDDEVLAFEDTGSEYDYAHMWKIILRLMISDWFLETVSSFVFIDEEEGEEDVLSQAWKIRKTLLGKGELP